MSVTKYFIAFNHSDNFNFNNLKLIIPPLGHFYADPFLFYHNNSYYLFFEDWNYDKGSISCISIDNNLNVSKPINVLDLPYHLSFPYVFRYKDGIYMIPETTNVHKIQLFRSTSFPDGWEYMKTLVNNIWAPDVSVLVKDDRVYLFTNDNNLLKIYHSDSLFGTFTLHSNNHVNCARSAGNIFEKDGNYYRPTQNCKNGYGKGVCINLIVISPSNYSEIEVDSFNCSWFPELNGFHSYSKVKGLIAVDGRLRIKNSGASRVVSKIGEVYKDNEYVVEYVNNLVKKYNK